MSIANLVTVLSNLFGTIASTFLSRLNASKNIEKNYQHNMIKILFKLPISVFDELFLDYLFYCCI